MEHAKGVIEALSAAAKDFGVGFWSFGALLLLAIFVWKLPEVIKAISTFVTEHRKTTAEVDRRQKRLDLEIGRKKSKIPTTARKETHK